jgi:hypothetical protein
MFETSRISGLCHAGPELDLGGSYAKGLDECRNIAHSASPASQYHAEIPTFFQGALSWRGPMHAIARPLIYYSGITSAVICHNTEHINAAGVLPVFCDYRLPLAT